MTALGKRVLASLAIFVVAIGVIGYEELASYRSKAMCIALSEGAISHEKVGVKIFESVSETGHKSTSFVHEGIVPFSEYLCTVVVYDQKVEYAKNHHRWSL